MPRTEIRSGIRAHSKRALEMRCVLALSRVSGIGPMRASRLIEAFGSARAVLAATESDLAATGLLNLKGIRAVQAAKPVTDTDAAMAFLRRRSDQVGTLLQTDAAYPDLLRQISQPPPLLWTRGRWIDDARPAVAIVGSRNATERGRSQAWHWAYRLASAGVTIVSGLAMGIDAEAHQGALDAGGHTIAVMGTGIDRVYPSQNRRLASDIVQHGVLISEFDPGLGAQAHHFPRRNRIIAGLSHVVVVIEAALDSGSLITADLAQEVGRDVGIVPGRLDDANAKGSNEAIKENLGVLMTSPDDVFRLLHGLHGLDWRLPDHERAALAPGETRDGNGILKPSRRPPIRSSSVAGRIRQSLEGGSASVERLMASTSLERDELESTLLDLLLEGRVQVDENQRYCWLEGR